MALAEQVVVFRVGEGFYAVPIGQVREVVAWTRPTPLPGSPPHVEGVLSLRGEVIPVVDLGRRFGRARSVPDAQSRILVVEIAGQVAGMVVDTVTEVLTLADGAVQPVAPAFRNSDDPLVVGVFHRGDDLVVLVDLERVVGEGQAAVAQSQEQIQETG
ncbi:MAG: chemotaxis protein CheW [Bacillota bacterium]|nr:MAG: chemotaxis protein CheW [Bacillota bacterium]